MSTLVALLRVQGVQAWRNMIDRTTGKSVVGRWIFFPLLLAGLVPLVAMFFTAFFVAFRVTRGGPGADLILGALLGAAQVAALLFGLFYLLSAFFYGRDRQLIAALPVHPVAVAASKFFWVVLGEWVSLSAFVVPGLVAYGLQFRLGADYWLRALWTYLWLPVLPLALDGVLLLLLSRVANLSRSREMLRVAGALVALTMLFGLQLVARTSASQHALREGVSELMQGRGPVAAAARYNPLGPLAAAGVGRQASAGGLAGFTLASAAGLGLLLAVSSRHLMPAALTGSEVPRRARRVTPPAMAAYLRARPAVWALTLREFRLALRTPVYLLNIVMAILLPFLLAIPVFLGRADLQHVLDDLREGAPPWLAYGGAAIAMMGASSTALGATAVSREGRLIGLSRALPLPPGAHVWAKLALTLLAGMASGAAAALVMWLLGAPPLWLGAILLSGPVGGLAGGAAGLAVDLFQPYLDWTDPQQAMKGNFNSFLGLLAAAALALPAFGLGAVAGFMVGAVWALPVTLLLLAAGTGGAVALCIHLARRTYGAPQE